MSPIENNLEVALGELLVLGACMVEELRHRPARPRKLRLAIRRLSVDAETILARLRRVQTLVRQ